ncbi:hypothetical protein JOF53_000705 [Crossiella equi]|uniref:DUF4389 domain-containing protein n=1 Tax=Crossiella equi TaxID=130796 RepID=A0ABS5A5G6_9PSEU|nr:DUF4389 domain-containing protein [Crossiella equi]MBP2471833.1 hypothetical protein [Crossiella equi]
MSAPHPLSVTARPDADLSRWLWLVKWLLALPHYLVLAVLWPVAVLSTMAAFVWVLCTGRHPRPLFDFTLGVLCWTWRVAFYSYGVLGTDRYPPFSLGPCPDYPAALHLSRPERLSRGLALVKWWLLALPHYLVLGALAGSGTADGRLPGALGLLVLYAGTALLCTGRYPSGLFRLVTGCQRWGLRVAVYALLLTDTYPPFRLDQGGEEPVA